MDISEQVKELRKATRWFEGTGLQETIKLVNDAADTIESFSAKLQAANIERPAEDSGGWITDRIPTKEECGDSPSGKEFAVTVCANSRKTLVMDFVYETVRGKEVAHWKWRDRISPWEVIAWHKLPEPYQEP